MKVIPDEPNALLKALAAHMGHQLNRDPVQVAGLMHGLLQGIGEFRGDAFCIVLPLNLEMAQALRDFADKFEDPGEFRMFQELRSRAVVNEEAGQ